MPCIVHVRVMRYISGNWLSNLIDVRMSPLNFQVIAEIKVCVEKMLLPMARAARSMIIG